MDYKRLNTIIGWMVFIFATSVYFMTLEPTVSQWDCGEYITTAYKLEVGHPPGAPLFMMLGRLFTIFASAENAALMYQTCIEQFPSCSGAIMAAIIVARALALRPDARVSLLTLGHWLPLLGLLPMAHTFRGELARLANASGLDWLDFSAPPDGCCFALCDPFAACHVSPAGGRRARFKLLNPRFVDMFDPQEYLELKKNRFELHFQYLKAAPKGGDYSYFDISRATGFKLASGVTVKGAGF